MQEKKFDYLITGTTGFLGSHLCQYLTNKGYRILATGRNISTAKKLIPQNIYFESLDLNDLDKVDAVMAKVEKGVIHCAALSSLWGKYDEFYQANFVGTSNLIKSAIKHQLPEFIHISTPTVYVDKFNKYSLNEETPLPKEKINYYAKTKYLAELEIKKHVNSFQKSVIIRPQGIYGIGDTAIRPRIQKLMDKGLLPVFNKSAVLTDLAHVKNVCHSIYLAVISNKQLKGEIFNITDGSPINNTKMIEDFFISLNVPYKRKYLPFNLSYYLAKILETSYRVLNITAEPILTSYSVCALGRTRTLDISKAKAILNYSPIVSTEDGLKEYMNWWRTTR